jgi:hypothetical protein
LYVAVSKNQGVVRFFDLKSGKLDRQAIVKLGNEKSYYEDEAIDFRATAFDATGKYFFALSTTGVLYRGSLKEVYDQKKLRPLIDFKEFGLRFFVRHRIEKFQLAADGKRVLIWVEYLPSFSELDLHLAGLSQILPSIGAPQDEDPHHHAFGVFDLGESKCEFFQDLVDDMTKIPDRFIEMSGNGQKLLLATLADTSEDRITGFEG